MVESTCFCSACYGFLAGGFEQATCRVRHQLPIRRSSETAASSYKWHLKLQWLATDNLSHCQQMVGVGDHSRVADFVLQVNVEPQAMQG
jgi:hypothetical protein